MPGSQEPIVVSCCQTLLCNCAQRKDSNEVVATLWCKCKQINIAIINNMIKIIQIYYNFTHWDLHRLQVQLMLQNVTKICFLIIAYDSQ